MSIGRLDGILLQRMLQNGLYNLQAREREINKLNVFPVADGDTGTNMRLTLENGLRYAPVSAEVGKYLCSLSNGMLLGARGNSGVILSQIFKGIYEELARATTISAADLRNGLIRGYRVAYRSVLHPVEGTILTVTREGIEAIRRQIGRGMPMETMLSMYIAAMKKSLKDTPELLPVLKNAGVVDSGAMGYVTIVEGMLKCLYGETLSPGESGSAEGAVAVSLDPKLLDRALFNENTPFEDGYCMEFLLQLMYQPGYLQNFSMDALQSNLQMFGNSLVTVRDDTRIKVHVHTKVPDKIIAYARQYGEFLSFKLENMQLQHNERLLPQKNDRNDDWLPPVMKDTDPIPLAVITVANGDGMRQLFSDLGCAVIINGGALMNPSAFDFLRAMEVLYAKQIVILPNNKNSVPVAEQATQLYHGDATVTVLPSTSMAEGYFALAMDISDHEDLALRIRHMQKTIAETETLGITAASKNYRLGSFTVQKGDEIAVAGDKVIVSAEGRSEVVMAGLRQMQTIHQKETCIIFRGSTVPAREEAELEALIAAEFPDMEIRFYNGGQQIYHWLIGLI